MKIGIIGAGEIAGTMAETIQGMREAGLGDAELFAIASRSPERAEDFRRKYGMKKAYGSYEELVQDPEVELIYIATPHSHHAEQMKLCIRGGKPVLCEKSFTANEATAREVLELAEKEKVMVTEAAWTRYQPMREVIRELVDSGIIGKPKMLTANLSYEMPMEKERLRSPHLAGGAMLDVGIYPLNFAEMVFGRPDTVRAECVMTKSGVDESVALYLTWKDGKSAVLNAGMTGLSDRKGIIYGTHGYIEVENINNPERVRVYGEDRQLLREIERPKQITGFEYELMEAMDAVRQGNLECASMPHAETLHIMNVMDEIRRQLGVRYPFEDSSI